MPAKRTRPSRRKRASIRRAPARTIRLWTARPPGKNVSAAQIMRYYLEPHAGEGSFRMQLTNTRAQTIKELEEAQIGTDELVPVPVTLKFGR